MSTHKSGFVNIIGAANVGKSTLMNILVGEQLSVITHKPQTTRHRILGIVNDKDYQIIFSDSPGIINEPHYELQSAMNKFAYSSFEDADVLVFMLDGKEEAELAEKVERKLAAFDKPKVLIINKCDILSEAELNDWKQHKILASFDQVFYISALKALGIKELTEYIVEKLPEGPEYYPKDQLTDKSERFFVSEIIRKNILELYHQEIPYSIEVIITNFKERENRPMIDIRAEIYVERNSQKQIVIGKGGKSIKQLGINSRKEIEKFVDKQVFLELFVKIKDNWRDDQKKLNHFGYK